MILQAYDFLELARRHDCVLQMGGSDQWGNIVNGVELGRRIDDRALFGLTTPLITTASGAKMGKTAAGAVWLNADRSAPTTTGSTGATPTMPMSAASCGCSPTCRSRRSPAREGSRAPRSTRRRSAWPTRRRRSPTAREAAEAAAETARRTFEEGGVGGDLPTLDVPRAELERGIPVYPAVQRARPRRQQRRGAPPDQGRRRAAQRCAGRRRDLMVTSKMLSSDGVIKLSAGKKKHALVRAV